MLIQPVEVRTRKKQRKLGTEVADLKLKLSQTNKNIVLSNREIRLLRYAFDLFTYPPNCQLKSIYFMGTDTWT